MAVTDHGRYYFVVLQEELMKVLNFLFTIIISLVGLFSGFYVFVYTFFKCLVSDYDDYALSIFLCSTMVLLCTLATMVLGIVAFAIRKRNKPKYSILMFITTGLAFVTNMFILPCAIWSDTFVFERLCFIFCPIVCFPLTIAMLVLTILCRRKDCPRIHY